MAEEYDLVLDMEGFEKRMAHEQELSAKAHLEKMSGSSGKDMRMLAEQTSFLAGKEVPATVDDDKYVWDQELSGCKACGLFIGR
eukprot:3969805-Ditylum_brightwellii.AAC.1